MFGKNILGLDIHQHQLRAIRLGRHGKRTVVSAVQMVELEQQSLNPSFSGSNILDSESFSTAIKQTLGPVAGRKQRLAVALPDRAGHLFLLDLDKPVKSRLEGAALIRWHLRDELPHQLAQTINLDYQILQTTDDGLTRVLAAVINEEVRNEYEEAIRRAGYDVTILNFHTQALFNFHLLHQPAQSDYVLIGVQGYQLCLMVVVGNQLVFLRTRTISIDADQAFREVSRTLAGYCNDREFLAQIALYVYLDWPVAEQLELHAQLAGIFHKEPTTSSLLPVKMSNRSDDIHVKALAAAWGAADQLIGRWW